jgi:hypothetical protein
MGPKTQNGEFIENGSKGFAYISAIHGDPIPK